MKFGLGPYYLEPTEDGPREAVAQLVEQARLAQEWGFDSVWVGEELFNGEGRCPAAAVVAAAIAARTSSLRIGLLLPLGLSHPLYTAEDVAVLDNISGGRVIVGAGPPAGDAALAVYGIDGGAVHQRFAEALEVCLRAWAPAPFRFEGRHFRVPANLPQNVYAVGQTHLSVTPKPAQPAQPVWVQAVDEESVRLAARLGLPLLGPAGDSLDDLRARLGLYRSLLGHEPIGASLALMCDMDLSDVEAAIAETERYRDELGVNYLICRLQRPGMSASEVAQAIRLAGRCLIPEFRMFGYPRELRSVSL